MVMKNGQMETSGYSEFFSKYDTFEYGKTATPASGLLRLLILLCLQSLGVPLKILVLTDFQAIVIHSSSMKLTCQQNKKKINFNRTKKKNVFSRVAYVKLHLCTV